MKQYAITVPGSVVTQKTAAAYIARLMAGFFAPQKPSKIFFPYF